MALSKYGLEAKAYADNYAQWQNEGGEKAYNDALNFKSLQDNSFNVRNFLGGGNVAQFGQSLIDGTVGVIGNLADFAGNPGNIGTDLNNYVMAQESAMGEAPKADFSWDYIANGGLARGMGNLTGSVLGLAAPTALGTAAGVAAGASAPVMTAIGLTTAALSGGLEAMAEGGSKLRETLSDGESLEQAQGKAREVAAKNAALLIPGNIIGLSLLKKAGKGIRTAFKGTDRVVEPAESRIAKASEWLNSKLSNRQKTALEFGKGAGLMGGEALNESMQEAIQQGIQDSVEPDKYWSVLPQYWNPEQEDAFKETIGPMILMGGAGGAGRVGARKLGDMLGVGNTTENAEMPNFNNNLFGAGTASYTTQGPDIDAQVEALKPGWSAVIPQVFGVLENRFGITGAQISSGGRTREHNAEVGGSETSYHISDEGGGDALDIVLPDNISKEEAEKIKEEFEDSGVFSEVLFHDAGSGNHLHLGGLKTDSIGDSYGTYSGNSDLDVMINEVAEQYGVDPALLAAVADQESGFDQGANSGAGAIGIMQLMPDTATGLGVDPNDLRGNLEGGAKYLRQMLDAYDGDVEKALAAYNAGPSNLDSVNGDISQLSDETKNYVPSVLGKYKKYKGQTRRTYGKDGSVLNWDSVDDDYKAMDYFPADGEESQGTANEFLENLAKLGESENQEDVETAQKAMDALEQYSDDDAKLTKAAKELGYKQTVDPSDVHSRVPMKPIVKRALQNGEVTFATQNAADIFASTPVGQTMQRDGKTFKITDDFSNNDIVTGIQQETGTPSYSPYTGTATVAANGQNGISVDPASANAIANGQSGVADNADQSSVANNTPLNTNTSDINEAVSTAQALSSIPESLADRDGMGAVKLNALQQMIDSGDLDGLNRINKYMADNLRRQGIDPVAALNAKGQYLPAVQGERLPSTDVEESVPIVEGEVEDVIIPEAPYTENQLEAPAIESEHISSDEFKENLNPVERGFMDYLDKVFDNLQMGFDDVLDYLKARQNDIFNRRMETVIQQGVDSFIKAFSASGGRIKINEIPSQEVQNAWHQLLAMRANFGATLANAPAEVQNEYMRVEKIVKDYLNPTITEQCKNNESWRKLNYAVTGLETIAQKARAYERSLQEEGKRSGTKGYRDVPAQAGEALENSAAAWADVLHKNGTTDSRIKAFLNTLGSSFTRNNHGMTLRGKSQYKGKAMNKAGRVEALMQDGGRIEARGNKYFAVAPNGSEIQVTKGEHNYYEWLKKNGFGQQKKPEPAKEPARRNNTPLLEESNFRDFKHTDSKAELEQERAARQAENQSNKKATAEGGEITLPDGYNTESGETLNEADVHDFIVQPNGSKDFGNISAQMEEATGGKLKSAPVRLQVGNKDFGYIHIIKHLEQIKQKGYDVMEYIEHILNNFSNVYSQQTEKKPYRFVLYCNDESKGFMPIDLELESGNNYYTIVSLMPHRSKIKGTSIFDGSANPSIVTTDDTLLAESNNAGGVATSANTHGKNDVPSVTSSVAENNRDGNENSNYPQSENLEADEVEVEDEDEIATLYDKHLEEEASSGAFSEDNYHGYMDDKSEKEQARIKKVLSKPVGEKDTAFGNVSRKKRLEKAYADGIYQIVHWPNGLYLVHVGDSSKYSTKLTKTEAEYFNHLKDEMQQHEMADYLERKADYQKKTERKAKAKNDEQNKNTTSDSNTKTLTPEENISNGKKAVEKCLDRHEDVPNAMYREEVGNIDFVYGQEGTEAKDHKDGYGISKILLKHGQEAVDVIPEVVAKGRYEKSEYGDRAYFILGQYRAVVRLTWDGKDKTWLVTNFEDKKIENPDGADAFVRSAPTTNGTVSPLEQGSSSAFSIPQKQKNGKKSSKNTNPKNKAVVWSKDGKEYNVHYEVRPESELVASHDIDGFTNPEYPKELQPRERDRSGNRLQVIDYAQNLNPALLTVNTMLNMGAPLIREDGVIFNGTGRLLAIRKAVKDGTDNHYKEYITEHAEELGLNPADIEGIENPVLVKVIDDELTKEDIDSIINDTSGGQSMGASEQAKADAKKIKGSTLELYRYKPSKEGELSGVNTEFLANLLGDILSKDEINAYYGRNGNINQDGAKRAKRALFALAYGDDHLIDVFSEDASDLVRNFINALSANAPYLAKLQQSIKNGTSYDLNLRDSIVKAVTALRDAVLTDTPAESVWRDISIWEEMELTPETRAMAQAIDGFRRSGKKVGNFIASLIERGFRHGDPNQTSMFSGTNHSLMDDISRAKEMVENGGQSSLFENLTENPVNKHSADYLKENGNTDTELDRLPKVPMDKLRKSEQKLVKFGAAIGVKVHFVESSDKGNRGVFTHNGEIYINRKAAVPAKAIFVHEFVHWLKASPENAGAYDVLHACLENLEGIVSKERIDKYRKRIFDGENMTDEEIAEEIICDAMSNSESAGKLMRAINNIDASLAAKVGSYLKAMWDKFCKAIGFNPKKLSREQTLPNELSVSEMQKADAAFNRILMNLKDEHGKHVFKKVGTELFLAKNNSKPSESHTINPIGYTYNKASSNDTQGRVSPRTMDTEYTSIVEEYRNETDDSKKESVLDKIRSMVARAAERAGFVNAIPEQTRAYTVRTRRAPKKTKKVYKVFTVDENGRPSALFVSSKDTLPQNVWLDANDTFAFTDNKNGRKYIPSTKNPNTKGGATGEAHKTENISAEDLAKLEELGYIKRNKQGQYPKTITGLAYRPGWHAGDLPFFPQGGKQGDGTTNYKNIHRYNQVVFECEIAYDTDYTNSSTNSKGQIVYTDMQEMPTDGGYKFATNPMTNQNDLGSWYISGSLKIGRALTEEECNKILADNGFKPQEWQAYGAGNDFVLGRLDLAKLGYTGEEFDAARKTLAPITYDDNGNVIPLSQRFDPNMDDVRYSRDNEASKIEANISNGLKALDSVIATHEDVHDAMNVEGIGSIDLVWGTPGKGSKFKRGFGISHIIAKRNSDYEKGRSSVDGITTAKKLIEVIANGKDKDIQFADNSDEARMRIHYNGYTAILSMPKNGNNWLLTGWEDDRVENKNEAPVSASDERDDSSAATAGTTPFTRHTGETNASVVSSVPQKQQNGKIKRSRSRDVGISPSTDGVAIAQNANNNLLASMKGIVNKLNPLHHEELENLRIDRKEDSADLSLIESTFTSAARLAKKYKAVEPFFNIAKQAVTKQEQLRYYFNSKMNEIDETLGWSKLKNDPKFKERKEQLQKILFDGDIEGREYTNAELTADGYGPEVIKAYRQMRSLLDYAWKIANDTKSRIKYHSLACRSAAIADAEFADIKAKNPFAEIISKVKNADGTVTLNYKEPHTYHVAARNMTVEELETLKQDKDVHIQSVKQSAIDGNVVVTYDQRNAGLNKRGGYIPHVFHGWYVCKVDKDGKPMLDADGNVDKGSIMVTADSMSEAVKLGEKLAKQDKNGNYVVTPQTFSAPGAQEQAVVMGDYDYAKVISKVANSMTMSIADAKAMMDGTVKMKNRGRFYGYAMQRKGFSGYEQNVYLATMKYFNQTARYVALDPFKRNAINMYNRTFGNFDDDNVASRSATAKWIRKYISDMNGNPTWVEKMINSFLHGLGLGKERAGGRPALWVQQNIFTYPMTIMKLGILNPASSILNLTQLFNLYGAMGEKVMSGEAYRRLLGNGFRDTFKAMSDKNSALGKLLWEDLGLNYQIGMDISAGYSNAEVTSLASLRGFTARMAGKSMYLFRQSDAFTRGVTLLTAYNKALSEGKSKAEAIEYAKKINDKVNFDYSVADEPWIFRAFGPISKVFLQFKKYPVKQIELFHDFYLDGREAGLNKKQAALRMLKYMAPYMAMSGMMGIPFISLAGGLFSALMATAGGDDDWDWEKKMKQYMIAEFGEDSPLTQWWLYGGGAMLGINVGSRIGVGDFMGSDSYNSADGIGGLLWNQTTLGSTINQVAKQVSYRNYAEAVKAINPTVGNILQAYKGDVRTTRGRMKYEYQNLAERIWRAIGFTPLNEAMAGDLASFEYAEKQEQTKGKERAVDDFLADPSEENAQRLNEYGVTPKTIQNEVARRTMNRHDLNQLEKEKAEEKAKKQTKKDKAYSANDYLKNLK